MPSDPTILAFDTSAAHCAVALLMGGEIVARSYEEMARGQAERLPALVEQTMAEVGAVFEELDAIGVGVGPGNFTGIRIGVSYARGLALALRIPAIGVPGFEVSAVSDDPNATVWKDAFTHEPKGIVRLPGPGGVVYQQVYNGGPRGIAPKSPEIAPLDVDGTPFRAFPIDWSTKGEGIQILVGLTAKKFATGEKHPRPAPLYIRSADAAHSRHQPPKIIG